MEWLQLLNRAIEYMEDNLMQDMTCEEIAAHVYMSPFHFQRTFHLLTGLTISEYIRNRRLSLAAAELQNGGRIIEISYRYGYETPESFTKAFRRFHGITPSQARNSGVCLKSFHRLIIKIKLEGGSVMEYKVVEKESMKIVAMTREFPAETGSQEVPEFWKEYYANGFAEKVCGMMGICIGNDQGQGKWKYGIGCEQQFLSTVPEGFEVIEIPAYTWAVFPCVGAMPQAIQNKWTAVYSEWLPQSAYELIQDYDIEFYTMGDSTSPEYRSEIWIPVRKKY